MAHDPLPTRKLGRTGLELSEIGFGAGPLGGCRFARSAASGVLAAGPFNGGLLARGVGSGARYREAPPEILDRLAEIEAAGTSRCAPPRQCSSRAPTRQSPAWSPAP
jgi:aryl-alcohol dehydrogenase-like predicted oxidoreductase